MINISDLSHMKTAPQIQINGSAGWGNASGNAFYTSLLQRARLGHRATASASSLAVSNSTYPAATFTQAIALTRVNDSGSYSSSSSIAIVGS